MDSHIVHKNTQAYYTLAYRKLTHGLAVTCMAVMGLLISACGPSQNSSSNSPINTSIDAPIADKLSDIEAHRKATDADLAQRVNAALSANEALQPFHLQAISTNGNIGLTGFVETQAQIELAIKVTMAVNGVKMVNDHLTLFHHHLGEN